MKETNRCFLRIASKIPVRIQKNLYTAFEWIWQSNLQNFFPDKCFVKKWKLKFQVSKYRLRWNPENMTSSIMSPQKKITPLPFLRALYNWKLTSLLSGDKSQLAAPASHNYNRNNHYKRPHLDQIFLYKGSSTTTDEVKIIFIYPLFFRYFTAMLMVS